MTDQVTSWKGLLDCEGATFKPEKRTATGSVSAPAEFLWKAEHNGDDVEPLGQMVAVHGGRVYKVRIQSDRGEWSGYAWIRKLELKDGVAKLALAFPDVEENVLTDLVYQRLAIEKLERRAAKFTIRVHQKELPWAPHPRLVEDDGEGLPLEGDEAKK